MKVHIVFFDCPPSRTYVIDVFRTKTAAWAYAFMKASELVDQNPGSQFAGVDNGYEVLIKRPTWMQHTAFTVEEREVRP